MYTDLTVSETKGLKKYKKIQKDANYVTVSVTQGI
jgi:hypothetical protein